MTDNFATSGVVATVPRHVVTQEGLPITNFRLAASNRKFNRATKTWENGETNWFTVTAFRQLAMNASGSIAKGDRVIVTGRLRVRDWENGDRGGTIVEIDASTIGHDLNWGTATYVKTVRAETSTVSEHEETPMEASSSFDPDEVAGSAVPEDSVSDGSEESALDWAPTQLAEASA
jgi:single-strand DNA-binding protein